MKRRLAWVAIVILSGCSTASPSLTPTASAGPSGLDCGELATDTCHEVANAAHLMLGTSPLVVDELELPDDNDGLQMVERYLVRLEPDADGDELVEVVRFAGSDNWSVRRAPETSGDN